MSVLPWIWEFTGDSDGYWYGMSLGTVVNPQGSSVLELPYITPRDSTVVYREAQKSKPLPNDPKIVLNRIKPASEIRFIRQIKV